MKTKRRHDLETNELARRITVVLEQARPYTTGVLTVFVIVVAILFVYSLVSRAVATARDSAWDAYNSAIEGRLPDLQTLKRSSQLHAGTRMQQWADIMWADAQVLLAAQRYLQNREVMDLRLIRAAEQYRTTLRITEEESIRNRAHLGMARVYEMRDQLDQARDEYLAVGGAFAGLARARIEELNLPQTQRATEWLVSAELEKPAGPEGPGVPGERPEFNADEVLVPEGQDETEAALQDIIKRFDISTEEGEQTDRYDLPTDDESTAEEGDGESDLQNELEEATSEDGSDAGATSDDASASSGVSDEDAAVDSTQE